LKADKSAVNYTLSHELETTNQRMDIVEQELEFGAWYKVSILDSAGASSFPYSVPYTSILGPKTLPFKVQGEFRTNGPVDGIVGIVYHVIRNDDHPTFSGWKVVLKNLANGDSGPVLQFHVSQHTSYYESAESMQSDLDDGNWHSFEAIATATIIQVIVDGIQGPLTRPSDERGVQTVKEFGRIENAADYVIGQDPCCTHYGEQRKLSGEIRNVALSWLLQAEVQDLKVEVAKLKSQPPTTQLVSGGKFLDSDQCVFSNLNHPE